MINNYSACIFYEQKIFLIVNSEAGYGTDEIMLSFGYSENENGTKKLFSNSSSAPSLYMGSKGNYLSVAILMQINLILLCFKIEKQMFYRI